MAKLIVCEIVKPIMSSSGGCAGYNPPRYTGDLLDCLKQTGRRDELIITAIVTAKQTKQHMLYAWDDLIENWDSVSRALDVLVALHEECGLAIRELADEADISPATVRTIFHGEQVSPEIEAKIERALERWNPQYKAVLRD
jgi:L-fucose mutarotase/ribose pyranase (RbsD/FucU family)